MKHAKLSASSSVRWINCPGSVALVDKHTPVGDERTGGRAAAEGTLAHEIAAAALSNIQPPNRWLGKKRIYDDRYEIEVDEYMIENVKMYVDEMLDERQPGDLTGVEMDLLDHLKRLDPDMGGHCDYWRFRPSTGDLLVVDFKYGKGVVVEAKDNSQLMIYAIGVWLYLKKTWQHEPISITVGIYQPRAQHPAGAYRRYVYPASDIKLFAEKVKAAAEMTRTKAAAINPTDEGCRFCPVKPQCPALKSAQDKLMSAAFDNLEALTPEQVVEALPLAHQAASRARALQSLAYRMAKAGTLNQTHGLKLVDKEPRRVWKDEAAVVRWGDAKAVNVYKTETPKLATPAQVELRLRDAAPRGQKAVAAREVEGLTEWRSSGTVLVPVSDPRPAVSMDAVTFDPVDEDEASNI